MPNRTRPPISVGRFQLVFTRRGDRFGHCVTMVDPADRGAASERELLESIEGAPDEVWPASPVLQELHCEARDGGRTVALLVGHAGKNHWSLSVLCDPAREQLLFEAACRYGQSPQWLGSRYRAQVAAPAPEPLGPGGAGRLDAEPCALVTRADGGLILGFAGNEPTLARATWCLHAAATRPQELALAALPAPAGDGYRTVWWSYRVGAR